MATTPQPGRVHWHDASDPDWFPYATREAAAEATCTTDGLVSCTDASCLEGWSDDGDADVTEWARPERLDCWTSNDTTGETR